VLVYPGTKKLGHTIKTQEEHPCHIVFYKLWQKYEIKYDLY